MNKSNTAPHRHSLLHRCGKGLATVALSRRFHTTLLTAVVAVELTMLGVGVTRRLELANEESLRVSEAMIAAIEAQQLGYLTGTGSASIGSGQGAQEQDNTPTTATPADDTGDAPALRSMDPALLDWQDLGDTPEDTAETDAEIHDATAAVEANLSRDQQDELDRLIRKGVTALTAGDMRLCILSLEQARTIAPDHPALLYYYGLAYEKLENPQKARSLFTKVFEMRDRAGKYFQRASQRLTFGSDRGETMRGKLSFGPYQLRHTHEPDGGENVDILLPVMLAPGEEVSPDDIYITIQFFDLVDGRRIEFSRMATPQLNWQNESPSWSEWEENLIITYSVPPLTPEEQDAYGSLKYYGFTAKLYYKGEPLDCISTPSSLILQEQRLNSRKNKNTGTYQEGLLPDDGLAPAGAEEALPMSDFLETLTP